ncbi:hypothetical protein GCM10011396_52240 [Undibacterium terreum]|uniref:Inositolphosphotransferase Aur1/Ipt1 domain-containing protein n=2 Tax=Undibacterium terreum TaxID=1224302 RepID=A0A916V134_9BURK|nr:hypothetical protein GCM10011396_52240 [Undibacterium terreum]
MLLFNLCYLLANSLAQQQHIIRDIALPFERNTPFIEWMVIPYLSSGIFFVWSFLQVESREQLRVLSQRLLLATVCASLIFFLYPLRFSLERPALTSSLFAPLFHFLSLIDKPYNQLPSLHVAYCLIFWQSLHPTLKRQASKIILAGCLFLVAASTLFTYQHHLLDLVGGLALAAAAIRLIPAGHSQVKVGFYYTMAAAVVFMAGVLVLHSWLAGYLCISMLLVALAYQRRDRFFLPKRNGKHTWLAWLMYAPYLSGYWLTWLAVRFRERHRPAFIQFSNHLWIGRRLSEDEAGHLPPESSIIDLSCELGETAALRSRIYLYFPLLDLVTPEPAVMEEIAAAIRQEIAAGHSVYLHCAMGYSRCILLAKYTFADTKP